MTRFFAHSTHRTAAAAASSALAIVLSGCGMGNFNLSGPITATAGVKITGSTFGGQQPVSGSTVGLYVVGASGYGSAPTLLKAADAVTTSTGNFTIADDYVCPAANPGAPIYLQATGGNPGYVVAPGDPDVNNTAIKLVAVLGPCNTVLANSANTFVRINEVSTVAAAFAMGQYFITPVAAGVTPAAGTGFGSPNTTQALLGMGNAANTVANMVDLTTATALTTKTIPTSLGGATAITVTPEPAKINLMASIMAACVNTRTSTSTECTTYFNDTPPTGSPIPTDTLQAAVFMSLNPTSNNANGSANNLAALYALKTPVAPFDTPIATTPADWTLGINYSPGASATQTLINGANDIAIDAKGNVWLINYNMSAPATESLTELSPTGTPIVNPFNSGATLPASMASASPRNLNIDSSGNVFVSTSSSSAYTFEYKPDGTTANLGLGNGAYQPILYGADLYVTHFTGTTISLDYFPGGTLTAANRIEFPYSASPSTLASYGSVTTNGTFLVSNGGAATSITAITGFDSSACTAGATCLPAKTAETNTAVSTGTGSNPFSLAATSGGAAWIANNGTSTLGYYTTGATITTNYGSTTSLSAPRKVAIDGVGNAWVINRNNGSISAISGGGTNQPAIGTALSPTSATPSAVGFVKSGTNSAAVSAIAVDPSGNVWVSNSAVTGTNANSIFELVGAAAPAVTPIGPAIKAGTVATRP